MKTKIQKAKQKKDIKEGINTALQRIIDKKPISAKVITLIEEICNLCDTDINFHKKIKDSNCGKFSVFTDLSNTKQWVNIKYHKFVRGTPAFIACVDFDIYLSETGFKKDQSSNHFSWEDIVNKIKQGPNIARWGEGGIVLISDYDSLEEMGCPYENKDNIFVEIPALRRAGVKIKKQDWELEKEKKKKTIKTERKVS